MRAAAWLLSLCGCNQVFDLTPTSLPPADAAPRCPDSGPPPFSNRLVQAVTQPCDNYSYSTVTHRALAVCLYDAGPVPAHRRGPGRRHARRGADRLAVGAAGPGRSLCARPRPPTWRSTT